MKRVALIRAFARLRFVYAMLAGTFLLVTYGISVLIRPDFHFPGAVSHCVFMVSGVLPLAYVAYSMERYERGTFSDHRTIQENMKALEALTLVDGLTGVANRRAFDEALDREWKRAVRAESVVSLILFGIDAFKAYNDTYGHQGGDDALKKVAEVLAGTARRAADVVARYGGEEFVILFGSGCVDSGPDVAELVRARVEELAIPHSASPASDVVTISAGVATIAPKGNQNPSVMIDRADAALYEAKDSGRNCVCTRNGEDVPESEAQ